MDFDRLYYIMEIIGTIAFASSGALVAIRKGMDIFGIVVLAIITATGGGIFRDIVLGITPPSAFIHTIYASLSLVTAIVIIVLFSNKKKFLNRKFLVAYVKVTSILDAIGLGIFTVNGVNMAMKMGYGQNQFLLMFVGIVTGCGGGIVRDLCSGVIPIIFTKNTIYALASLMGAASFVWLRPIIKQHYAFMFGIVVVIVSRILSMKYRWSLPNVKSDLIEDEPPQ